MLPPQQVLALAEAMNLSEMDRAVLIDGLLESLDSPKGIESVASGMDTEGRASDADF